MGNFLEMFREHLRRADEMEKFKMLRQDSAADRALRERELASAEQARQFAQGLQTQQFEHEKKLHEQAQRQAAMAGLAEGKFEQAVPTSVDVLFGAPKPTEPKGPVDPLNLPASIPQTFAPLPITIQNPAAPGAVSLGGINVLPVSPEIQAARDLDIQTKAKSAAFKGAFNQWSQLFNENPMLMGGDKKKQQEILLTALSGHPIHQERVQEMFAEGVDDLISGDPTRRKRGQMIVDQVNRLYSIQRMPMPTPAFSAEQAAKDLAGQALRDVGTAIAKKYNGKIPANARGELVTGLRDYLTKAPGNDTTRTDALRYAIGSLGSEVRTNPIDAFLANILPPPEQ